ncbi:CapA family protein [Simiduia litorea]|uniref:CapA family protein n=1 Tax=Simiduia litorea TaxID=1435348 RepID=UPI0036F2CA59
MQNKIRISFVGDVSPGDHYFSFGHGPRKLFECGHNKFSSIREIMPKSDIKVCNLEGAISDFNANKQSPKSMVFRGCERTAERIKEMGFDVVNVANNHTAQHGPIAFHRTKELLYKAGLSVIGLVDKPYITRTIGDTKVTILGASLINDNTDPCQNLYYNPTPPKLIEACKKIKEFSDVLVLYIHWGTESTTEVTQTVTLLSRELVSHGVEIIVGHHPHVVQPIHLLECGLIAYSLGNFIFDLQWSKMNVDSIVLTALIEKNNHKTSIFAEVQNARINSCSLPSLEVESTQLSYGLNTIYEYNTNEIQFQAYRKLLFLIKNILRGNTSLKIRFLMWKLLKKI